MGPEPDDASGSSCPAQRLAAGGEVRVFEQQSALATRSADVLVGAALAGRALLADGAVDSPVPAGRARVRHGMVTGLVWEKGVLS